MNTKLLSVNSCKSLAQKEEMFTTKQVAEQLTVNVRTINRAGKKCFPNKEIINGKTTFWSKAEVTMIIDFMQKKNNRKDLTSTTVVQSTTTELTPALKIKQAMDIAMAAYEEELERIKVEKLQVETERDSLQIELDQSKDWYSIKRMEMLNPGKTFNWRTLKAESEKMGIERKDVFDANYGEVKAYHRSVWESIYFDSINYED